MTDRFMDAVLSLRYQQLEALLRQGVSVNTRNRLGQTPVMVASYIPDVDKGYRMVKFLLGKGADILERDDQRVSVFQHACKQGRERVARRIVREMGAAGADLSGTSSDGRTPLFDAVTSGSVSLVSFIVKLMRDQSIGVDAPDDKGTTPLIQAYKLGLDDVAAVLEQEGRANLRICDGERHMNATEWREEASRRKRKAQALHKERTREHKMIYSHVDHRKNMTRLPDIQTRPRWQCGNINNRWTNDSARIAEQKYNSSAAVATQSEEPVGENRLAMAVPARNPSVVNMSLDSAMTLLKLASQTSNKRRYATSFVSSEFDTTKAREYGHMSAVSSLLSSYSGQFSSTFRKATVPLPRIEEPDHSERPVYEKKPSTLAYIMGRGGPRGNKRVKKVRPFPKGSAHSKTSRKRSDTETSRKRSNTETSRKRANSETYRKRANSIKLQKDKVRSPGQLTGGGGVMPHKETRTAMLSVPELPGIGMREPDTVEEQYDNEDRLRQTGEELLELSDSRGRRQLHTPQPRKLSRVPEDEQNYKKPVSSGLNNRESLPSIGLTAL